MAARPPAVSILTPSYGRPELLQRQHAVVSAQTVRDFEWLILDDSPAPSAYFTALNDPRVRYHHHAGPRMTIGAKRNWLAARAAADTIAHFDDDDYYAPGYLAAMTRALEGVDIAKLSAWFVYSALHRQLAYWDTRVTRGLHFSLSPAPLSAAVWGEAEARDFAANYAGYGFSYVYRRAVWQETPFPEADFNEDLGFVTGAAARGRRMHHFADTGGLCLHVLRTDNVSTCFPQHLLPGFMVARFFGEAGARYVSE